MITFLDFPLYLMEIFKKWSSLHGFVMIMFFTTISKGFACEAPSSPQCFKPKPEETVYTCEWSLNSTESDVTFDLYFNHTKFENIKNTSYMILEEELIQSRSVNIWVEAHLGNTTCKSPKTSLILEQAVKYEAPQNILVSWLKSNLSLRWQAPEKHPALAEVWFRRVEHPTEPWKKKLTKTIYEDSKQLVIVANLLKSSAYQVQIRQQSNKVRYPLWSKWSLIMVPAELEHEPNVTMTTISKNGTRTVTLTWTMPRAALVNNVMVNSSDSKPSCPCMKKINHHTNKDTHMNMTHIMYVSYSAVNISVIAKNDVGESPPAIIQVPLESASDLKTCTKTLLDEKLNKKTCLEFYEFQDASLLPKKVITLTGRMSTVIRQQKRNDLKDYIRYLYFEHRCHHRKPQTVKMCLFYQKEGVPAKEPQGILAFNETHNSAELSWKPIPYVHQHGFLTHYSLCRVKISSQPKQKVCYNISTSKTKFILEKLTPATKYNITLAGVTRVGQGPKATVTINTLPEKPLNVWLSFSLLFVFFLFSTMCTIVLKRIKTKIFPPVPKPVITDFINHQQECQQGMLEKKEEVHHELSLHQLLPEGTSISEETEDATVFRDEWDDGTEEGVENERSNLEGCSDESSSPDSTDQALRSSKEEGMTDLQQVDTELAMLIYRNGLVFDMKTELP